MCIYSFRLSFSFKPKSNNSLLLTEDKKALKKTLQCKNKVRFCLDENTNTESTVDKEATLPRVENKEILHREMQFKLSNDDLKGGSIRSSTNDANTKSKQFDQITNSLETKKTMINTFIASKASLKTKTPSENLTSTSESNKNNNEYSSIQDDDKSSNVCILRVFLENQTIKSFKYDKSTCVRDVLNCLKEKLNLKFIEYFGLVVKMNSENFVSKFITLDETRPLCKISDVFSNSNTNSSSSTTQEAIVDESQYQCMFRFMFIPSNYNFLILNDENSFNYLYEQVWLHLKYVLCST